MKGFLALRPHHWFKNFLIFLPLVFSGSLASIPALTNSLLAFFSFCALSSATYLINDYADQHKDRLHPEKKHRPIAAGHITPTQAILLAALLTGIGFGAAIALPLPFLYTALAYFIISQAYTAWLKHEAFADVITLSINYVIRAVAGALTISVWVSPWLITGVFFLALFILLGKRRSELMLLQEHAPSMRKALTAYTPDIASRLSTLATTTLVICYTLFVFFGQHQWLFLTLPFSLYAIFRYESFVSSGNRIARSPEYVFTDKPMMTAMILWAGLTLAILYL